MKKHFIILVSCVSLLSMPAWAINEKYNEVEHNTQFAEFTGEHFFKSSLQLEKENEAIKEKALFKQSNRFINENERRRDSLDRGTMPPVKKLRMKHKRNQLLKQEQKLNAQKVEEAKKVQPQQPKEEVIDEVADKEFLEKEAELVANAAKGKKVKKVKKQKAKSQVKQNTKKKFRLFGRKKHTIITEYTEPTNVEEGKPQVILNGETMNYIPERYDLEVYGNVSLEFPAQRTKLTADKIVYNSVTGLIKAIDNVVITRDGSVATGDYMQINMNDESGYITNLNTDSYNLIVHAEKGYVSGDTLTQENGSIQTKGSNILQFDSQGFSETIRELVVKDADKSSYTDIVGKGKYYVKVKDIIIDAKKSHDRVTLKKAVLYKNDKKVCSLPSVSFYTNKQKDYFEGNYPELGSDGRFGMFVGPGLVLEAPFGSTLKLIPTVNYKNNIGFGGIARFKSGTNKTDIGYSSASSMFMVKGEQKLDDNLILRYGSHSYMDNWFLGGTWQKYGVSLDYENRYIHNSFLGKDREMEFADRLSLGYFQEDNKKEDGKTEYFRAGIGTTRLRYMASCSQTLYKHSFVDEDIDIMKLDLVGEGSAAVYGTGDLQFIGRVGPRLTNQYKYWRQDLGFAMSAYHDKTPIIRVDQYRYGKANVYLREYIRLHKFVTVAWYGSLNLSGDEYDYINDKNSKIRECSFYVSLGPDDLKLNLGWDAIRNTTYFGFTVAMDTKDTVVEYDKMVLKNISKLNQHDDKDLVVGESAFKSIETPRDKYLQKAVVTDVLDKSLIMKDEVL